MKGKRGFTFIELIITIALIAVIGLLTFSIFGQGVRLFADESKSANEQLNMRQALSDITNKARITDPQSITYETGVLHIGDCSYTFDGGMVKKNGTVIAKDIASFEVTVEGTLNQGILLIEIVNTSGKSLSTSISLERWIKENL